MELKIVKFFNDSMNFLNYFTRLISWIPFLVVLWTVLTLLAFFSNKTSGENIFVAIVLAVIFHFLISEGIIKELLSGKLFRVRPYIAYPEKIIPIGENFTDSSLPSSHMSSTLAVLTVLIFFYPQFWLSALAFVLFMAFARIHNGMHYPTDILIGTVLGIVYGLAGIYLADILLAI